MVRGRRVADTSIGYVHTEVIPDNQVIQGQTTMNCTHGVKRRKSIEEWHNPAPECLGIRTPTDTHPILTEIFTLKNIPDRINVAIHEHPTPEWYERLMYGIKCGRQTYLRRLCVGNPPNHHRAARTFIRSNPRSNIGLWGSHDPRIFNLLYQKSG
jgi:hypothetical protein